MGQGETAIECKHLTIGYGAKAVQTDLSFSLRAGEMVCMLGQNGCGKSTLLHTLAGLLPPIAGTYTIAHTDTLPPSRQVALVLTERLSLENTSVHDVVALGRYPYTSFMGGLTAADEQIIAEALDAVGLFGEKDTYFNNHSDGEKQRVLIAKAIAQQTPVVLLDEPTAHLDLPNRIRILQLLRRLAHEQQKTVLISTHELDLALALSDRILLMTPSHRTALDACGTSFNSHGKGVVLGTPGQGVVLDTPAALREQDAFTAAFGMDIFHPLC